MINVSGPVTAMENISNEDYSITFEEREAYLRAYIKGERGTLAVALRYWLDIAHVAIETGRKRLLVVEDIPEAIAVSEVHQLVTEMSRLPVRDIKLAFVDLFAQHKSLNEFGRLVGENRGLSIRTFDTEEEAATWLSETE